MVSPLLLGEDSLGCHLSHASPPVKRSVPGTQAISMEEKLVKAWSHSSRPEAVGGEDCTGAAPCSGSLVLNLTWVKGK